VIKLNPILLRCKKNRVVEISMVTAYRQRSVDRWMVERTSDRSTALRDRPIANPSTVRNSSTRLCELSQICWLHFHRLLHF